MENLVILQSLFPNIDIDVISVIFQAIDYNVNQTIDSLLEIGQDAASQALPDDFLRPPSYFRNVVRESVAGGHVEIPIPVTCTQQRIRGIQNFVRHRNSLFKESIAERISILRNAAKKQYYRIRSKFSKVPNFTETKSLLRTREDEITDSSDSENEAGKYY